MIEAQDIEMIVSLLEADTSLKEKFKSALFSTNEEQGHRVCSYCGKTEVYAKNLCRRCYERMRRYGSPQPRRRVYPPKKDFCRAVVRAVMPWQEIIARKRLGDMEDYIMPPDLMESVEAYIEKLPERAQGCVLGYFRDGKTYRELGEKYNLSRERIRQIIWKAIFRMDSRLLTLGKAETLKIDQQLLAERQAKAAEIQANAKENFQNSLRAEAVINANMLLKEYLTAMDCSVRAYNCVVRGLSDEEYRTLKVIDFVDFIFNEKHGSFTEYFWGFRNCGRKTAEELASYFVKGEE